MGLRYTPTEYQSVPLQISSRSPAESFSSLFFEPDYSNLRVIQDNLVFVSNLPECISTEETLLQEQYFGQYGSIVKCRLSRPKGSMKYNAYITFVSSEEASLCIKACHLFNLQGHQLEATLGTTRYCTFFLKHSQCPRTDCVFLHQRCPANEIILKDTYSQNKRLVCFNNAVDNTDYHIYTEWSRVLPAVRKLSAEEVTEKRLECEPESPSSEAKRTRSRFWFVPESGREGGDDSELIQCHSPSRKTAHLSSEQYEEIMSPVKGTWASDVLHAIPVRESFNVLKFGEHDDTYLISAKGTHDNS